jgi:hypothetical protein
MTLHTRPEIEASALPIPTEALEPGEEVAARLGIPYMRLIDGRPTIMRTHEEP